MTLSNAPVAAAPARMLAHLSACVLACVLAAGGLSGCASQHAAATREAKATEAALKQITAGAHRSPDNRARDAYRHPLETLLFFGIRTDMHVVEVWPGNGWYTEILAPLLRDRGQLYAAHMDATASEYAKNLTAGFRAKLESHPELYDKVVVTTLAATAAKSPIAPAGSVDLVVTFRNLHNWMMFGWDRQAFEAMYQALKPGGVLGIVEHRGNPKIPQDPKASSGYVNEDHAIELIRSVGFTFAGRSQINANPRDTKDYEKGVWALPPNFANGEQGRERSPDRYGSIGESDRFTLKFVKPAT